MPENHKQPERGFKQLACEILDISTRSYSNFSKQKRLIITLLEKYFTKEDLQEFIEFGKINNFENNNTIQEYFIETNKNKYIQSFNFSYSQASTSIKNIAIAEGYFILDFYFYFLSNFFNESNFDKSLSEYRFKAEKLKLKRDNVKINISKIKDLKKEENNELNKIIVEYFSYDKDNNIDFKFDEEKEEQYLIEKILENENQKLNIISNILGFIRNWDKDMIFFINHLIKTDFELFINSGNDELLYHAIGFLVYSNNDLYISKVLNFDDSYSKIIEDFYDYNLTKVDDIYDFFIQNKDKINKNIIKDVIVNSEKLDELKKYKIIEKYFKRIKQEVTEEEIDKIITDSIEFEKIDKKLKEIITKERNDEIMNNLLNLQKEGIKI